MDRREFVQGMGAGVAAAGLLAQAAIVSASEKQGYPKIGMCDWNLMGGACKPERFELAERAGLDGIQVSVATSPDNVALRDPKVRKKYAQMCEKHNIAVCSVAAGSILNSHALATEPQSAVYVIEALEAAKALGADNILMAFFGNGDLRLKDGGGENAGRNGDPDGSFMLDEKNVLRVIEVLRQIAPRAEDAGVILGLENTISARQNLRIIEAVGSPMLQVYYDIGNSTGNGYPVVEEIPLLGKERICEVHLKDWKTTLLGSPEGQVDMAGVAKQLKSIGYEKWLVLETSGRDGKKESTFVEDTQANVTWARKTFA